jgi:hypothetical protein
MTKRIRTPSAKQIERWNKLIVNEPHAVTDESKRLITVIQTDIDDGFPACFDELESFLALVEELYVPAESATKECFGCGYPDDRKCMCYDPSPKKTLPKPIECSGCGQFDSSCFMCFNR